jgi:hypothetical protein
MSGVGTRKQKTVEGGIDVVDFYVTRIIDESLVQALGRDLSLALRVCLDTTVALKDPIAYATALKAMLGARRAQDVLSQIQRNLRSLGVIQGAQGQGASRSWRGVLETNYSRETVKSHR